MEITVTETRPQGIKLQLFDQKTLLGHAYLYLLLNDLHKKPFGFLEDVWVEEQFRSKGYGTTLVQAAIEEAKKRGCYKLIGTSRYSREKVHTFYQELGFTDYGKEFRMDL